MSSSDRNPLSKYIGESPWFDSLPIDAIESLASQAAIKKYTPEQFLYTVGQVPDLVFCVVSGSVRVSVVSSDGQQFMLALLYPGYWFGESAIVGGESRVLEIWAEAEADILVLPGASVRSVAKEYPVVYESLFKELMSRTQLVYELLAGMLFYPLKSRLAGRLLFLLKEHGQPHEDGVSLDIKMSQMDFARMSMGSRQRVNKTFREWVRDGVIEKRRGRYIIKDIAALENVLTLD